MSTVAASRYLKPMKMRAAHQDEQSGKLAAEDYLMLEGTVDYKMFVITEGTVIVEKGGNELGRLRPCGWLRS
eukprot:SAG11_NODE_37908_length_254_cov_1.941935_1_plen_71_part_01